MDTPGSENAMTEIALALAMGFFSLMVLTLISFGAPEGAPAEMRAVAVAPSEGGAAQGVTEARVDDLVVILLDGGFVGADLAPLTPEAVAAHRGRVTLAVRPDAPLGSVIDARARLSHPDLVVTQLDRAWLDTIAKETGAKETKR